MASLADFLFRRPWYKSIESTVWQSNIARLNTAYQNFFDGRGFTKFKNPRNFRSFEYKPKRVKIDGSRAYLPSIGWMRFYNSRPIPKGFVIKTVTIRRKTDGWYTSARIEDKSIPEIPKRDISDIKTVVGIDLGLTKLAHCSDGSQIDHPRQLLRSWYVFFFQLPFLPEFLLQRSDYQAIENAIVGIAANKSNITQADIKAYKTAAAKSGALTAMLSYYRNVFQPKILQQDGRVLEVPTLMIWGENDVALGKELTYGTEKYVKYFQIRYIPNCSHWVQQDAPQLVNQYIREFLPK